MTRNTSVKSYERLFKTELLKAPGVRINYEPVRLPILEDRELGHAYTPDFVLPTLYADGKIIVIEPHGAPFVTPVYLDKVARAKDLYNLYLVLASDVEKVEIERKFGLRISDYVDDYWYVPNPKYSKAHSRTDVEAIIHHRIDGLLSVARPGENYLGYLDTAARFYTALAQKDKTALEGLLRPAAA
ncbi:MAG: hypothetical protein KGH69_00090 [Candidatus Micrarchaeota archaeon]|nr:hypothetical protein [Candidatus Micrarchaeota archaeon]